jgi:aminomuconate-semialdehyde/2-hydroxymuconate-6-semialdehyde dehydrogenase
MAELLRNYVNGSWVETGRTFVNINPVNGSLSCHHNPPTSPVAI